MKNNTHNEKQLLNINDGLTLVELLISTILMGIVMVSVASFSLSVKNQQASSRKLAVLSTRAQATINYIKKDAERAVGDIMEPGVWCHANGGSVNKANPCSVSNDELYLCFRYDVANSPTISDYSDDKWHCYYQSYDDRNIYKCLEPIDAKTGSSGPSETELGTCKEKGKYLPLLEVDDTTPFVEIVYDENYKMVSVGITLKTSSNLAVATHPINNPGYEMRVDINPTSHSR